jgi:hypothetical protein
MEIDRERFKKLFPHLAEEVFEGASKVQIDAARVDPTEGERAAARRFASYNPTVIDFIRRCDRAEQAEEIISFMERRGEVAPEYAEELRQRIRKEGLRSLGPKKKPGFYEEEDRPQSQG